MSPLDRAAPGARRWPALAGALAAALSAPVAAAGFGLSAPDLQVGAGLRFDDNAFTTERNDREIDEFSGEGFAELSLPVRLGRHMLLFLDASASDMRFGDHTDLGQESFGAAARLRFAPSIHVDSWLYETFFRYGEVDVRSDRRDTKMAAAGFLAQRNIGFGNRLTLGVDARRRESRGQVHDLDDVGAFVNLDRQWSKRLLSYTGYRFLRGDVVANGSPRLGLLHEADAIEADEVLGGLAADAFVYRLEGDSHVFTVGANYLVAGGLAADVSWRGVYVNAAGDNAYYRNMVQLLLLWKVF